MTTPHSEARITESTKGDIQPDTRSAGRAVDWSDAIEDQPTEEAVLQISGMGHWFLEGWIGDHAVDFLVDSGSAVTVLSCKFYQTLLSAGAPVGVLRPTDRRLRGANGSSIEILGCSSCVVSFLGLQTEFPVLVCDLSTDAIIGTDTLGSILPHTLDIKRDCCLRREVHHFNCTVGMLHCPVASSPWDIVRFHHALRRYYTAPHGQWAADRFHRVACWRDSLFLQKTQA